VIPSGLTVTAPLTIEPCAVVRVGASGTITVRTGGSLAATGTAARPVTFERLDAARPWSQIRTIGGTLRFTHTRLLGGGDPQNSPLDGAAVLLVSGVTAAPAEVIHADHVEIRDSASQGVILVEGALFSATSTALVVTGAKHVPLHVAANLAGSIPEGAYTGNAIDQIVLEGGGASSIVRDTTFHDRGVPYRVGDTLREGRLDVAALQGVATLTIEPNVKIRFKKAGSVFVQFAQNTLPATGALVAVGTADRPIVFTSDEAAPLPGDWQGIHFNGLVAPATRLAFVRVEYAGGDRSLVGSSCAYENPPQINNAAIRVFTEPPASFISNTTIVASKRHGFDRGWLGTPAVSFLGGGNTVQGGGGCNESFPRPQGACPVPPPCPL
jgi:hypothetical protein